MDAIRLAVFLVDPGVANMSCGQSDNLLRIGRIGKNFLITGHSGIEDNLTNTQTLGTNGTAVEQSSISERKNCVSTQGLFSIKLTEDGCESNALTTRAILLNRQSTV